MGSEGVVYMTWWWKPVLEASRSSRLSVVGYTSWPAHTKEDVQKYICWHSWSWPISLFLIIANSFVSKHVLLQYVVTSWIWMLFFVSPLFKPSGWAFCIFSLSCKHGRWQQASFPTFLGSCHFPKMFPSLNDNENDNHFLTKCLSLMDGPDAKRFLRWFFAVEYYHLLIAIFSLLCIFSCGAPLL